MVFKSQVSVEYMTMVALSLAALTVVWLYVNTSNDAVKQDLRISFARQAVVRLADAAKIVSIQGSPAKIMVDVTIPEGVLQARPSSPGECNESEIFLQVAGIQGKATDVFAPVPINVSGNFSLSAIAPGVKRFSVEAITINGLPCVKISG